MTNQMIKEAGVTQEDFNTYQVFCLMFKLMAITVAVLTLNALIC